MKPESEVLWRVGDDPIALLEDLYPRYTLGSDPRQDRKCRLYLIACARRQWDRLPWVCRRLVEVVEFYTDHPRSREPLRAILEPIAEQLLNSDGTADDLDLASATFGHIKHTLCSHTSAHHLVLHTEERERGETVGDDWRGLVALVYLPFMLKAPPFRWVPRELHSVALLREVYYNPYRLVPFPDAWRTYNVLGVARGAYDSGDFSSMPILGDALEEAGCDNTEILNHCRYEPVEGHARGCWVLNRVLEQGRPRG